MDDPDSLHKHNIYSTKPVSPFAAYCVKLGSLRAFFNNLLNIPYASTRATKARYCITGHYHAYHVFEENKVKNPFGVSHRMWAFGGCRAAAFQAEPDARQPGNAPMRLRRNAGICLSSGNPLKRCGTLAKVLLQPKAQLDCRVMGMSRHSDESLLILLLIFCLLSTKDLVNWL